jgi:hypothetical protein
MELGLGRFGDRRLEKGGPFFWGGLSPLGAGDCGSADWAAIGRERFA